MRRILNLEIHVAHACNLTCESCSNFSNHNHKGVVSLKAAEEWMSAWNDRIRPTQFSLLGGEPSIHPKLSEFVQLARRMWPQSNLRIVTNGFFLHRHPEFPKVLEECGNAAIQLSIHHTSPEYLRKLEPNLQLIKTWIEDYDIAVCFSASSNRWLRRYRGYGDNMEPFEDGDRAASWMTCASKYCRQLFDGKIWKCPQITYLHLQKRVHRLSRKWDRYLQYEPLSPTCTDEELEDFFNRREEDCCAMCPATPEFFDKPLPLPASKPFTQDQGYSELDPFVRFVAFDPLAERSLEVTKRVRGLKRYVDTPVIEAVNGRVLQSQ